jgi:hypothetical protein
LIAVLGWATGIKVDGAPLLEYNPWGPEQRRSHRMQMPKEQSPRRPSMTDEIRDRLIQHSPHWQFELALLLGRYTISRNSSVRRLRWSDMFRELDPKMKETLSRTDHETLIAIYDEVELDEMRLAIQRRRPAAQAYSR